MMLSSQNIWFGKSRRSCFDNKNYLTDFCLTSHIYGIFMDFIECETPANSDPQLYRDHDRAVLITVRV